MVRGFRHSAGWPPCSPHAPWAVGRSPTSISRSEPSFQFLTHSPLVPEHSHPHSSGGFGGIIFRIKVMAFLPHLLPPGFSVLAGNVPLNPCRKAGNLSLLHPVYHSACSSVPKSQGFTSSRSPSQCPLLPSHPHCSRSGPPCLSPGLPTQTPCTRQPVRLLEGKSEQDLPY